MQSCNSSQIIFREGFLLDAEHLLPLESSGRGRESHHRILSADSKVRVTLQNSIKHSGSESVNQQFNSVCGTD